MWLSAKRFFLVLILIIVYEYFDAIETGSYETVKLAISEGVDVENAVNEEGDMALHHAVLNLEGTDSDLQIIQEIINAGAEVDAISEDDYAALHLAVGALDVRSIKIAQLHLRNKANVEIQGGEDGYRPLHFGVTSFGEHSDQSRDDFTPQLVQELIDNGATDDGLDDDRNTPLHLSMYEATDVIVQILLTNGANANAVNRFEDTSLHNLAESSTCSLEKARLLFNKGIQVNSRNNKQETPLFNATESIVDGSLELLELFLQKGANVRAVNNKGETPLHIAAKVGGKYFLKKAELFLRNGADIAALDNDGKSPLDYSENEEALSNLNHKLIHELTGKNLKLVIANQRHLSQEELITKLLNL